MPSPFSIFRIVLMDQKPLFPWEILIPEDILCIRLHRHQHHHDRAGPLSQQVHEHLPVQEPHQDVQNGFENIKESHKISGDQTRRLGSEKPAHTESRHKDRIGQADHGILKTSGFQSGS